MCVLGIGAAAKAIGAMSTTSKVMMGLGAANSIFSHGSENRAIRARNRAKLANFQAENDAYIVDQMMQDTAWKDRVSSAEVSIDNLFQQTAQSWNQQDSEMESVYAKHAFDALEILTKRYRNEYAGEQTGVTAQRLADAPIRESGMALTQSVANVILNKNKAQINKEIALNQYKSGFREKWDAVRIAPQRGPTPLAPTLEKEAGTGSLLSRLALNVGGAVLGDIGGKWLSGKAKNWLDGLGKNLSGAPSASLGKDLSGVMNWNSTGSTTAGLPAWHSFDMPVSNRDALTASLGYGGDSRLNDLLYRPSSDPNRFNFKPGILGTGGFF